MILSTIAPAPPIQRYTARVSGPLLDRIDIHVEVPPASYTERSGPPDDETSVVIRARVNVAHERQHARFDGMATPRNAAMNVGRYT